MKELQIVLYNGTPSINSRDAADGLGIKHKNLLELIKNHKIKIESDFGRVTFETETLETKGGKQNTKVAYLTENQALFVGTLCRNTKQVVNFKSVLVQKFNEYRKQQTPQELTIEKMRLLVMEDLISTVASQEEALKLQAPKVDYHDKVLKTTNAFTTTQIAQDLNMSAIALNRKLKELGVHRKVRGQWVLKTKYLNKGYIDTETFTYVNDGVEYSCINTLWTQKGRAFIHELLSETPIVLPLKSVENV